MNEIFIKLKNWYVTLPSWLRSLIVALVAIVIILSTLFGTTSCSIFRESRVEYRQKRRVEKTDSLFVTYPRSATYAIRARSFEKIVDRM